MLKPSLLQLLTAKLVHLLLSQQKKRKKRAWRNNDKRLIHLFVRGIGFCRTCIPLLLYVCMWFSTLFSCLLLFVASLFLFCIIVVVYCCRCVTKQQQYPTGALMPNAKGKLPLHYAAREGKTAVVHFLLSVAPQTAAMASGKDKLALHFAAGEGHFDVVQALLRVYPQGACLPSAKGKLPLHFCSRWGHQNVAMELLRYYPDAIRALDWEGSLPLHEACREGQETMARFLMDRLPEALATANLRNEIPLFPAVRVTSLELVLDLLQAWPAGAKHVLQNVTQDDRIATWNPAVVEALLRATVECWDDFAPWQQNRSPAFLRLHAQVNHVLPAYDEKADVDEQDKKLKKKKDKKEKSKKKEKEIKDKKYKKPKQEAELGTIEERRPRLWTAGPFTSIRVERLSTTETAPEAARSARSKSPILDDETAVRPRKRMRSSHRRQSGEASGQVFCAIQAALMAQASLPVLKHAQQLFPGGPRNFVDAENRSLLHLALQNSKLARDDAKHGGADWILQRVYRPEWALQRDKTLNALPLHVALHSRASSRVVDALLQANPSSAVDFCATRDEWCNEKPLALACQSDCDFSTVYLLLRADPSVVTGPTSGTVGLMEG